jgi:ABC-2 type transport system ATP-binding protein
VSFRVEAGEILGFLGPNGAGKTTTMRIITGYMPATEGKVVVAGHDVFDAAHRGEAADRLPAGNAAALSGHDGARLPDFVARIKGVPRREVQVAGRRDEAHAPGWPTWPTATARSSRRATGSASASRRRSSQPRRARSSTSRRPGSTPSRSSRRGSSSELGGSHTTVLSTHILPEVSRPASASSSSTRAASWRWTRRQPHGAAARLGDDVPAGGRRRPTRRSALRRCRA